MHGAPKTLVEFWMRQLLCLHPMHHCSLRIATLQKLQGFMLNQQYARPATASCGARARFQTYS